MGRFAGGGARTRGGRGAAVRAWARTALSVIGVLLTLAYPAAVYFGLTRFGLRRVQFVLIPALVITGLARVPRRRRAAVRDGLKVPAVMIALVGLASWLDDPRFLLAMPVVINLVLLAGFGGSLRSERPLVERFARMSVDDLSAAEVRYCRGVTVVWSVFFALNASAAGLLAWFGPLSLWALYSGAVSYVLIGVLGASEYVIRKYRFGRFGDHLIDRVLRTVLTSGETRRADSAAAPTREVPP